MELPSKTQIKRYIDRNQSELTLGALYVIGTGILSGALYKLYKTYPDPETNISGPAIVPMDNGSIGLHLIDNSWWVYTPNSETTED